MLVKIAWRNVWRNRRRSLLTLAASSFGLAVLIFYFAFSDGIHTQMINNATRTSLGHIQIFAHNYRADRVIEHAIADPESALGVLNGAKGVSLVLPRVESYGLVSSPANSVGVLILGVDPAKERSATRIHNTLIRGQYLGTDQGRVGEIMIGDMLAKRLKAEVGEKIVLFSQAADGSMANALFRVKGIFRTGAEAMDLGTAYITLNRAQEFFVLGPRITSFLLYVDDIDRADSIRSDLASRLPPGLFEALSWKELDPSLLQTTQLDDAITQILCLMIFLVIAMGIVNTLVMSVFERTREFGVLLAMGMEPRDVVTMVSIESLVLGSTSLVLGMAVGLSVSLYFASHGINLTRWTQGVSVGSAFMEPILYPDVRLLSVAKSCAAVIIITLVSGLYPALKASRLEPVAALRHV